MVLLSSTFEFPAGPASLANSSAGFSLVVLLHLFDVCERRCAAG
jgi:hypothetical protein